MSIPQYRIHEAETILAQARRAQSDLWSLSRQLEEILECAVSTDLDLADETIESILERDELI